MQARTGQPSIVGELVAQRREFEADHKDFLRNLARGDYLKKSPTRCASYLDGQGTMTTVGMGGGRRDRNKDRPGQSTR